MTQISWNWSCSPQVGDAGPLTVENLMVARMLMGNARPDVAGVVHWMNATPLADLGLTNPSDGLLEPTNPAGDIVRIASGVGMVQGWLYVSDGDEDFDVSGGNANATDLIVLRRGDPAVDLSVRLALKRGPIGGAATVTQSALLWEVAIAEVLLDGSGDFSALTDVRQYVETPLSPLFPFHRQGGSTINWSTPGTTDYTELHAPSIQAGMISTTIGAGSRNKEITGITFPVRFSSVPMILLTPHWTDLFPVPNTSDDLPAAVVTADSSASFNLMVSRANPATDLANARTAEVAWLAIGPR